MYPGPAGSLTGEDPVRASVTAVAGVSGVRTPAGWVLVVLGEAGLDEIRLVPDLPSLLDEVEDAATVAVDLPLGHDDPEGGVRAADRAAREHVAWPESVWQVPPREVLEAADLASARKRAREQGWPEPAEDLFAVRDRVRAINDVEDGRLVEFHPEVSYQALQAEVGSDQGLEHPPGDRRGRYERLRLLYEVDLRPARAFGGVGRASPMDVLEATVGAWTARRVEDGVAGTIPDDPPEDPDTGRPVAVRF